LLDLGAGAGIIPQMNFRGLVACCYGIDPDRRVLENPFLDEAKVAIGDSIPYPDASFDVVISNNVLEHLNSPKLVFDEVARVLKPNGIFLVKTPNKWHYVPMIARITPHSFHLLINRWRGRNDEDTYPTYYKANTPAAISRFADASGLKIIKLDVVEGRPEYMRMTWLTYFAGLLYERLVNATKLLSGLRVVIIASIIKGDVEP
jgi:SAM-dependent methyltransferase